MIMANLFVGVDVSKAELVCRVLDEKGQERGQGTFRNGPAGFRKIRQFLLELDGEGTFFVAMEATGVYYRNFVRFVFRSNDRFVPAVFNPASVKAFAQSRLSRTKTDGQDALFIARYGLELFRDGTFHPWRPEDPSVAQLRQLVTRRGQLVAARSLAINQRHTLREDEQTMPYVLESVERELSHLKEQIEEIDRMIADHMKRHDNLREDRELLTSIPGIGDTTAASWLAHLGDLSRFDKPSQIVAHIGIAPQERQSGSSVRGKPRICRTGLKEVRKALFFPVIVAATRTDSVLKDYYQHLLARGKQKKVALIACMNKLIRIIWAILKSRKPYDPCFAAPSLETQPKG
jgi:transposase